jgi:hypothetical protein
VDIDRQADVAGQLDRGRVGVDHRAGRLVDDQHRDGDVGQHARQVRVPLARLTGDGGAGRGHDPGLLPELTVGVGDSRSAGGCGHGTVARGRHGDN